MSDQNIVYQLRLMSVLCTALHLIGLLTSSEVAFDAINQGRLRARHDEIDLMLPRECHQTRVIVWLYFIDVCDIAHAIGCSTITRNDI